MGIKGEHRPRGHREIPAASPAPALASRTEHSPNSTMKVLAATLVTLLLLATCSTSEGHLGESSMAVSPLESPSPGRVPVGRGLGSVWDCLETRGFLEGVLPGDVAPDGESLEGAEAVGSHQGRVSVPCPHRWRPQHLLLQLPEAAHPSAPRQLRLCHQQLLQPAGCDVSTSPATSQGGPGDTQGTFRVLMVGLRSHSLGPAAQGRFSPGSVVTKKGKKVCADPQAQWVKQLLDDFQSQKN